jgi:hypothetical protein
MEGMRRRGPAKFQATVEDTAAPSGRKIAQVMSALCPTGPIALDESPQALAVKEKVALSAMQIDDHGKLGIIRYPAWKAGEFSRGTEVTIDGKHGIIGRCEIT